MDDKDFGLLKTRFFGHLDRHTENSVDFDNMLKTGYAASQEFRAANSARIVMEAGSGRTRAETNNPANTAAPQ